MKEKDLKRLFGQRIKHLRRLKGLTQEELAEAIGGSVDTISNIERGFSFTRLETASHIAKTLGVALAELFEFSGGAKDSARGHRKEVERLIVLLLKCSPTHLPAIAQIIEQAVKLSNK